MPCLNLARTCFEWFAAGTVFLSVVDPGVGGTAIDLFADAPVGNPKASAYLLAAYSEQAVARTDVPPAVGLQNDGWTSLRSSGQSVRRCAPSLRRRAGRWFAQRQYGCNWCEEIAPMEAG
jgi:hypothetical protein